MLFLRTLAVLSVLLSSLTFVIAAETPPPIPPTPAQITQWVKDLSSDEFDTREKAEQMLKTAGLDAVPLLEKAAKEGEEEVKTRAERCLDTLRWSVRPDPTDLATLIPQDAPFSLITGNLKASVERLRAGTPLGKLYDDPKYQKFKQDFADAWCGMVNMTQDQQDLIVDWLDNYGGPNGIAMVRVNHDTQDWAERQWMAGFLGLNGKNPAKAYETFAKTFPISWGNAASKAEKYRGIDVIMNHEEWNHSADARVNRMLLRTSTQGAIKVAIDGLAGDVNPKGMLSTLEFRKNTLAKFQPNPVATLYLNLPNMVPPAEMTRPGSSFVSSGFSACEHILVTMNEQNGLFLEQAAIQVSGERKGVIKLLSQPAQENPWLRFAPANTLGGLYLKLDPSTIQSLAEMTGATLPPFDFITKLEGDAAVWLYPTAAPRLMPEWAAALKYADETTAKTALNTVRQLAATTLGDAKNIEESDIEQQKVLTLKDEMINDRLRSSLPVSPALCAFKNSILIASSKEQMAALLKTLASDETKKLALMPELAKLVDAIPAEERGGMIFLNTSQLATWGLPLLWQELKTERAVRDEKLTKLILSTFPKPGEVFKDFPGTLFSVVGTKEGVTARAVGGFPISLTFPVGAMIGVRIAMSRMMRDMQKNNAPGGAAAADDDDEVKVKK